MRYYHTGDRLLSIRRGARSVSYLMFAIGGWVSLFTVSPIVDDVSTHVTGTVWSLFLAIGATAAFLSVALDYWFFEYFGLPALGSSFFFLGVASLSSVWVETGSDAVYLSSSFIAFGVASSVTYRFWELHHSFTHSKDV